MNNFLSHLLLTKKGNGKYQAVIFQELEEETPDVVMNQRPPMGDVGQVGG